MSDTNHCGESTGSTSTTGSAAGRPAIPSGPESWGTEFPENPPGRLNKPILIVAVLGLLIAVFGVIRSFVSPSKPVQAAPVETIFTQQQKMMREAMAMAREARDAQREHMELMRRQYEESYGMAEGDGSSGD